jgi:integrase
MKGKFTIKPCDQGRTKFMVVGYINGKRKREFFITKAEAQVHCEKRNIELENYGHTLTDMSRDLRSEAIACNTRMALLGVSLTTAVDYYCAEFDLRSKSVTLESAWEQCKTHLEKRLKGNTCGILHYKTMLRAGNMLARAFPDTHLCDVTPLFLEKWLGRMPVAATTKNNLRTNLSGFFTFARKQGWIKENPCAEVENLNDRRLKAAKEPGIVTPEQAAALLENAEPEILPFYAIGLFAGLRVAELDRLKWSDVDFDEKLINVKKWNAKTGQARWVPMHENLLAWLAPYRQAHGEWVVPKSCKREMVERTRAKAGITEWGDDKANALRHSYCSYQLAASKNEVETAFSAGHSVRVLLKDYNKRVKQEVAFRYFSIVPAPEAQNIFAIGQ